MSRKNIEEAIEKTISETQRVRERQQSTGERNDMEIIRMNEYRISLENTLDYYDRIHPGPIKTVATMIIGPVSYILAPVILAGGLVYLGCREIINRLKNNSPHQQGIKQNAL